MKTKEESRKEGNNSFKDCPICLDPLSETERTIYPLPCQQCDYNFCSDCTKKMIAASKDDYEISSDGSRQVKVTVSCPQCRSKYPINDLEETVLLLREIHLLASSILKESITILQYFRVPGLFETTGNKEKRSWHSLYSSGGIQKMILL